MTKILIVDDKESNLLALQKVLKGLKVEIVKALTGEDALRACLNHEFALAILDVQMPGMDGYELAALLRSDQRTKYIPIIFLSAVYFDDTKVFKGYTSGAVDFITKPFNPEILLAKVRVFLELNARKAEITRQKVDLEKLVAQLEQQIEARKRLEGTLQRAHDNLERKVAERTAELEWKNRELQEFAFIASHDLQEPLRKIQTFCDMAIKRSGPGLEGDSREYMERVVSSAGRMRQLLRDLLQFSRAAAKPDSFEEIDLAKTIQEAADLFEEDLRGSGGLIEFEGMPRIEADEGQMSRLFQNLIGNAVKFRGPENPRIRIHTICDDGRCEIFVKDNGIGFDPQFAERIFKPLQRLHSRKEYEGTGMGLAICRKIVEWHGGSIRAESEPGKGSTFIIKLPLKHERKAEGVSSGG